MITKFILKTEREFAFCDYCLFKNGRKGTTSPRMFKNAIKMKR